MIFVVKNVKFAVLTKRVVSCTTLESSDLVRHSLTLDPSDFLVAYLADIFILSKPRIVNGPFKFEYYGLLDLPSKISRHFELQSHSCIDMEESWKIAHVFSTYS